MLEKIKYRVWNQNNDDKYNGTYTETNINANVDKELKETELLEFDSSIESKINKLTVKKLKINSVSAPTHGENILGLRFESGDGDDKKSYFLIRRFQSTYNNGNFNYVLNADPSDTIELYECYFDLTLKYNKNSTGNSKDTKGHDKLQQKDLKYYLRNPEKIKYAENQENKCYDPKFEKDDMNEKYDDGTKNTINI